MNGTGWTAISTKRAAIGFVVLKPAPIAVASLAGKPVRNRAVMLARAIRPALSPKRWSLATRLSMARLARTIASGLRSSSAAAASAMASAAHCTEVCRLK